MSTSGATYGAVLRTGVSGALLLVAAACARSGTGGGARPLDFTAQRPAGALSGRWVGGTDALGGWILVEAEFRQEGDVLTGELRTPTENVTLLPVDSVRVDGDAVRFRIHSPLGVHPAEGRWDGGMIFGRIEGGGVSGAFHLVPVASAAPGRAGTYSERTGHRLLTTARASGDLAWAETEPLEGGDLWIAGGMLYAHARDTVFSDRSIRAEPRRHEWAVFRDDGSIEWHPEERPLRVTPRVATAVVQEEVTFTGAGATLRGTLLLPPGPGPHPAVVMVHGSGPVERTSLLGLLRAELFLREGVGVLVYDKRGTGASTGDWQTAGVEALATDAAAGVALLRRHPGVLPGRVGLVGHSQGGWVVPAAAALPPGADFVVILSGGGVTPGEQETFRAGAEAAAAGLSADSARSLMELKWRHARTGADWEAYAALRSRTDPRTAALVEAPPDSGSSQWASIRALARYEPEPDLRAIRVPTLVVLGSEDDNVPVDRAAQVWRTSVAADLLTLEIVPGVGHALVGFREGLGSTFPAGLVGALRSWLAEQGRSQPAPTIPRTAAATAKPM